MSVTQTTIKRLPSIVKEDVGILKIRIQEVIYILSIYNKLWFVLIFFRLDLNLVNILANIISWYHRQKGKRISRYTSKYVIQRKIIGKLASSLGSLYNISPTQSGYNDLRISTNLSWYYIFKYYKIGNSLWRRH